MKLLILLLAFTVALVQCDTTCNVCKMTVSAMVTWYKTQAPCTEGAFLNAMLVSCDDLSIAADRTYCKSFANCQYRKILNDIITQSVSIERTCIDIGGCDGPLSSSSLEIVDWTALTHNYQADRCVPGVFLILHHTVTHAADETLDILNARGLSVQYIGGKDGTMYQMVHDYYRAWHAGTSYWRTYSDLNSWGVGIEIVNTGDEPFPDAQMNGVIELSRMLINRWYINPRDIVGHFDIHPAGKNDPSGYFDWKTYYTRLGLYTNIWPSSLTDAQKKAVLMKPSSFVSANLLTVQEKLRNWGYQGSLTATGTYDINTCDTIMAFNRHWCPEVFIPEKVDYTTNGTVINPLNYQWYGISQERLDKLLLTI